MPRGGQNRKPSNLKLVQGTFRPDRASGDEPKPRPLVPDPPPGMDYYALRAWRRLAPILERLGLLTEADTEMFISLCDAWGRLERARRRLKMVLRAPIIEEMVEGQASSDVLHVKETIEDGKVVGKETVRTRAIPVGRAAHGKAMVISADRLALIRAAEISVERAEFSFRQLATEFGLSPASRSRLEVEMPGATDFQGFLQRGQARTRQ